MQCIFKKDAMRRLCFLMLVTILAASVGLIYAEEEKGKDEEGLLPLYEKLKKLEIDPSQAAKLDNFSFKKDIVEWRLTGDMFLTKPVPELPNAGGAYFIGEGRMIFEPPDKIEKAELKRYTENEKLNHTFKEAFIRFNDDTRQIFEPLMRAVSENEGKKAEEKFKSGQAGLAGLLVSPEGLVIADNLNKTSLNRYLILETDLDKVGLLSFIYAPGGFGFLGSAEEVGLFKREKLGFGKSAFENIINMFNRKEDYEQGVDFDYEDKDVLDVTHYNMDFTIEPGSLLMNAKVEIHFTPLIETMHAAQFDFIDDPEQRDIKVTDVKITDAQGNDLPFLYKNFSLLIQLPKAYAKGEEAIVNVAYKADFIRPDFAVSLPPGAKLDSSLEFLPEAESTFTLLNTYPWFPQYGYLKRNTFDMIIRVPKPHIAVASGTTIKRWEEGPYNCLHSKEEKPVLLTSVLFGKYVTIKDDSVRPVIYVHSLFKQQRQAEPILTEARTIVTEYEKYFGPFPYDELDIAQMGFFKGFGQAPPGLVQLTGEAFLGPNELEAIPWMGAYRVADLRSGFLSHEIGHEWWAHVVAWQNYHEQWLSESFTEYMAGLYLLATKGPKEFEYKLQQWKETAYDQKDSGPIWLGARLQKGYFASLYYKGPYVLHMLRKAFNWKYGAEEGDKLFFDCMRNFCEKFRDKNPTTKDFQRVVKETAKIDMDWFFDQWFREAGFPELRVSYNTRQTEDGKYLVEVKVRQPDTEHVKAMLIPVFFHFGSDRVLRKDMYVDKEEGFLRLKLPEKPETVSVDDMKDLLATIVYE